MGATPTTVMEIQDHYNIFSGTVWRKRGDMSLARLMPPLLRQIAGICPIRNSSMFRPVHAVPLGSLFYLTAFFVCVQN